MLHARDAELGDSQAIENLLADLNESYNAKNKAWGFFQGESGAYPFSGWLGEYLEGDRDFVGFSREAVEHLQKLMEESNLSTGGHVLFAHYQQGMTDYLAIALLHHSEGVAVNESLEVTPSRHLDLGQLHLAARINISEWRNNKQSKQYISFIKGKGGTQQQAVEAVHLVHQGQGREEGLRLFPRLHRLPGRGGFAERDAHPAESLQRFRGKRGHGRGTGPREDRDAGRLRHLPGAHRRADDPRRAFGTDGRPAAPKACRSASRRTCWAPRWNTTKSATC